MTTNAPQTPDSAPQTTDRDRLVKVRDEIERRIADKPGSQDLATLSRELRLVIAALRDMPATSGVSAVDEVTRRREEREARERGSA